MTRALPHIQKMSPYVLADMSAPTGLQMVSLSQNESLRPLSPMAVQSAMESLQHGAGYPDPDWTALRQALGSAHGISPESILCGSGSLDLIGCIARALTGPDRAILAPAHAYPFFRTAAQMINARFDTAPEVACRVDIDAVLASVQDDTSLVFIANPANPTGTRLPGSDLQRLRAGLPEHIILVIDEAYGEFADHLNEPCWSLVNSNNCIVLRTFSKAYSMAGFRVGWGLFPQALAAEVRKVMNPNNLTRASQNAACAALQDQAYMRETCTITAQLRDRATRVLQDAGFDVPASITNFVLIMFENANTAQAADTVLRSNGVYLSRQHSAGLPMALRMTIGPEAATQLAVNLLKQWKQEITR